MKIYGSYIADNIEKSLNDPAFFDSMNPAYNMITDAASLAAFYEFLVNKGKTVTGTQLISEKTFLTYTHKAVSGWNKTLHVPLTMGRGFTLGAALMPSIYGWWHASSCFGHGGFFSALAFGDHHTKLAVAILTNGNHSMYDLYQRFLPLSHRIRMSCI